MGGTSCQAQRYYQHHGTAFASCHCIAEYLQAKLDRSGLELIAETGTRTTLSWQAASTEVDVLGTGLFHEVRLKESMGEGSDAAPEPGPTKQGNQAR
jgi:hypothetical protein